MLICGFEKFDKFFVRIDILERLFLKIIDNEKEIKLVAEMLNLLGCSKESFVKLINKMGYKTFDKNNEIFFKYLPKRGKNANVPSRKNKDNPFSILSEINFK